MAKTFVNYILRKKTETVEDRKLKIVFCSLSSHLELHFKLKNSNKRFF